MNFQNFFKKISIFQKKIQYTCSGVSQNEKWMPDSDSPPQKTPRTLSFPSKSKKTKLDIFDFAFFMKTSTPIWLAFGQQSANISPTLAVVRKWTAYVQLFQLAFLGSQKSICGE